MCITGFACEASAIRSFLVAHPNKTHTRGKQLRLRAGPKTLLFMGATLRKLNAQDDARALRKESEAGGERCVARWFWFGDATNARLLCAFGARSVTCLCFCLFGLLKVFSDRIVVCQLLWMVRLVDDIHRRSSVVYLIKVCGFYMSNLDNY